MSINKLYISTAEDTEPASCKARLDRPNDGSRSAGEGLCVLQSFLFTTQQEH